MSKIDENNAAITANWFKQFKHRRLVRWAFYTLSLLVFIALFAPVIANEKPLYLNYKGYQLFPAFWDLNPFADKNFYTLTTESNQQETLQTDITNWKKLNYESVIWCPIPYSPGKSDYTNSNFVSPFAKQYVEKSIEMPWRFRHHLGTGIRGEDVFAGIIHGTRIALIVGLTSMLIAAFIGLLLGSLAGYFGDYELKLSRAVFIFTFIGIMLAYFYGFYIRTNILKDAFAQSAASGYLQVSLSMIYGIGFIWLFYKIGKKITVFSWAKKLIIIPLDSIISRCIEIVSALPTFILILSLAAITKPSIVNLIVIIAFTTWTNIARLTRAEILRVKNLDFIQAAKALGYSQGRIILRHALANGFAPALVAIAFGIASTILIEASLSFLGIGLPLETLSWGAMLNEGRSQFSAWWMTLFPGIALFVTVTIYNLIGDALREKK